MVDNYSMKNTPQLGDIYQLGDHILACGSATDAELIERAVKHTKGVRMILSDPPYGVAYVENKKGVTELSATKERGGGAENHGRSTSDRGTICRVHRRMAGCYTATPRALQHGLYVWR